MSDNFEIEFTVKSPTHCQPATYQGTVCNVRGDGSCFWHSVGLVTGKTASELKRGTAKAMEASRGQRDAQWMHFQEYIKRMLEVPHALQGYALLDVVRSSTDPVELVSRPRQFAEEWMFPFVCNALFRDLYVVCEQEQASTVPQPPQYRAFSPSPRRFHDKEPVFVFKDANVAHYRAVTHVTCIGKVWDVKGELLHRMRSILKTSPVDATAR